MDNAEKKLAKQFLLIGVIVIIAIISFLEINAPLKVKKLDNLISRVEKLDADKLIKSIKTSNKMLDAELIKIKAINKRLNNI